MDNVYTTFTLRIARDNTIEARWSTSDQEETVPDARISEEEDLRNDIMADIRALRQSESELRERDIQRLGRNLYRALFPHRVGELFQQAINRTLTDLSRNRSPCLRIIIEVSPKSDAFGWPLEFLYYPERGGYWLATEKPWIALSRRTTFGGVVNLERQGWPLRVLVIVSRPASLKGVLSAKVLQEIGQLAEVKSLDGAAARKMEVKVLGKLEDFEQDIPGIEYLDKAATWGNIRDITSSHWQPHVVHFIGHGKQEDEEGFLALTSDERNTDVQWCNAERTTKLFAAPPRLIILQACESAAPDTARGYMSLATNLLQRNILAVIAMQFEIRNDDAILFAIGFYEALREGLDVDAAVQGGRWKISNKPEGFSKRHFGGPVLYMYEPFGIIQPTSSRPNLRPGSQPQAYSAMPQKPMTALNQAQRMLANAADLRAAGDEETAQIWIDRASNKLRTVEARNAVSCVKGALEMLELDDADGAIKMLEQAQRILALRPTVEGAGRANPQPPKFEPTVSLETEQSPPSLEVAATPEAGWNLDPEPLSRDRIKQG